MNAPVVIVGTGLAGYNLAESFASSIAKRRCC